MMCLMENNISLKIDKDFVTQVKVLKTLSSDSVLKKCCALL